ncbi:MAG: hypothetical protein LQ349_000173 [Xanthoria aureola]|nr:MAG: hypothetical protein LQ349_000173 [Xanthoria aureola]
MVSPTTEEAAYIQLGIADHNVDDGNVVASFYALYSKLPKAVRGAAYASSLIYTEALRTIAIYRQSRLLAFVLTILPYLDDHNVALLTCAPLTPMPTNTNAGTPIQDTFSTGNECIVDVTEPDTAVANAADGTSQDGGHPSQKTGDQILTLASSGLEENEPTLLYSDSPSPVAESASSADIPSSSVDLMDTSSGSSLGHYYDGQMWRCEGCDELLAACQCLDDSSTHDSSTHPCAVCGSEDANMQFCTYCSKCHKTEKGPCGGCQDAANQYSVVSEGEHLSELFWDERDGIWRCALCYWEVEANSNEEGYCHCYIKQDTPASLDGFSNRNADWCRRIELSEYPEYEPADSDSSGADSTDSEPDSGDEEFIEDNGPFEPAFVNLLAGNYDPFEDMSVCAPQPMDTDAETVQKDAPLQSDGPSIQS